MILRDSIDPSLIPLDSDAVAGYGDGIFLWSSAGWDRFPAATPRLVIVVRPGDRGDVADVEAFDFAPGDAPGFVLAFDRPGRRAPSLYVNRANWPAVVAALVAAGLDPTAIDWWIATLDGGTILWYGTPGVLPPPGLRVVAVQVRDVGPYDESVVLDPEWIGGTMTPTQAAQLQGIFDQLQAVFDLLVYGQSAPGQAGSMPLWGIAAGDGTAKTDAILAAVKALTVPAGTTTAQLAAALRAAAHQLDGQ